MTTEVGVPAAAEFSIYSLCQAPSFEYDKDENVRHTV